MFISCGAPICSGNNKTHFISWKKIYRPKENGGLGIRSSLPHNKALLTKLLWRVIKEPDKMWAHNLKKHYSPKDSPMISPLKPADSWIWKGIIDAKNRIWMKLIWHIGDGENIDFWLEPWISGIRFGRPQGPAPAHRTISILTVKFAYKYSLSTGKENDPANGSGSGFDSSRATDSEESRGYCSDQRDNESGSMGTLEGSRTVMYNMMRMDPTSFRSLVAHFKDTGLLRDSKHIDVEEKLAIFLHIIAHNMRNRAVNTIFQHSAATTSKVFYECLDAMMTFSKEMIVPTNFDEPPRPIRHHKKLTERVFRGAVGALDGTLIPVAK
ncbi:hypothetical protein GIB67_013024 [Kingdonia uniflora]|uniref:DUF8040 domain-containing protein n=1 Tax=Kingdonia uniflora TaxID=39325 RepID=A0A7J7MCJ2_9MAGN|nr:hypothetical protein GIB67_013024 [Kingdonia uniflora]